MLHGCHCSRRPIGYADVIQRGADTRAATDARRVACLDSSSSYLAETLSPKTLLRAEKTLERSVSGLSGGSFIILLMWHPPCTNPGNTSHPHPPRVHHIVETQLLKIQHFPPPPEHPTLTQRMGSQGANISLRNRASFFSLCFNRILSHNNGRPSF